VNYILSVVVYFTSTSTLLTVIDFANFLLHARSFPDMLHWCRWCNILVFITKPRVMGPGSCRIDPIRFLAKRRKGSCIPDFSCIKPRPTKSPLWRSRLIGCHHRRT